MRASGAARCRVQGAPCARVAPRPRCPIQPPPVLPSVLRTTPRPHLTPSTLLRPILPRLMPRHLSARGFASDTSVSKFKGAEHMAPKQAVVTSSMSNLSLFKRSLRYMWPAETHLRVRVVAAAMLLLGSKALSVQVPYVFKLLIDDLTTPAIGLPLGVLLMYGAVRACASLFNEVRNAVFAQVGQAAVRRVATEAFLHLLRLDLDFHLSRQTGALSRAIDRGMKAISFLLTALVFNVAPTILEIGLVCAILGNNFGIAYALATVGTMTAYTAYTFVVTQWRTRFRKEMNAAENDAASKAMDSLLNYETVQYFGNEKLEVARYDACLRAHDVAAVKSTESLAALNWGQNVIFSGALVLMMALAAEGVIQGRMSVGDLVMVNGLVFQLSLPLNFLGTIYRETRQSLTDLEALFGLLALKSRMADAPDAQPLVWHGGSIRFEDVHFGYANKQPVLKGVSFEIPAGRKIAIVGASGSGKSTFLRLLFRFYQPSKGRILIDGQDIAKVSLESLRSVLGVVPQDTVLFNDTLYHNISYGRPSATRQEVEQAASQAALLPVISALPEGFETRVGERGLKLSGGEKQRVAIARCLLKRPGIVLCDEATSALDAHTEAHVLSSLRVLAEKRTSVIIAHRLSTVLDADDILVLRDGLIVEHGSPTALLSDPTSEFARLQRMQQMK